MASILLIDLITLGSEHDRHGVLQDAFIIQLNKDSRWLVYTEHTKKPEANEKIRVLATASFSS